MTDVDAWLPTDGSFVARLGGDGHLVRVTVSPLGNLADLLRRQRQWIARAIGELGGLLIYLGTPALFSGGFAPGVMPAGARLVAAAVGRPQVIAGWDLAHSKPKPVRRAAPAGSVYYYKVEDAAATSAWVEHTFKAGLGSVSALESSAGFGWALPGVFDARSIFNLNQNAH